jgi:hypothetical protein
MSTIGFRPWKDTHEERLRLEFESICWHEAGHFAAGVLVAPAAVQTLVISTHKRLGYFEGRTGVDLAKVPSGNVAGVALAGCMAEAKADALTKGGFRFLPQQWEQSTRFLLTAAHSVDPANLNRLIPLLFDFETDEDDCFALGGITAADIFHIPDAELDDAKHLKKSFRLTARMLDTDQHWKAIRRLAEFLMTHPNEDISPELGRNIFEGR